MGLVLFVGCSGWGWTGVVLPFRNMLTRVKISAATPARALAAVLICSMRFVTGSGFFGGSIRLCLLAPGFVAEPTPGACGVGYVGPVGYRVRFLAVHPLPRAGLYGAMQRAMETVYCLGFKKALFRRHKRRSPARGRGLVLWLLSPDG
jgi:hypothetical protein